MSSLPIGLAFICCLLFSFVFRCVHLLVQLFAVLVEPLLSRLFSCVADGVCRYFPDCFGLSVQLRTKVSSNLKSRNLSLSSILWVLYLNWSFRPFFILVKILLRATFSVPCRIFVDLGVRAFGYNVNHALHKVYPNQDVYTFHRTLA
jgi:hypothetical protein